MEPAAENKNRAKLFRTLTAASVAVALLLVCGSSTLMGQTDQVIDETGVGPFTIGALEATINKHSQPQKHGSIVLSLPDLGGAIGSTPTCFPEAGCGFVTPSPSAFPVNSCDPQGDTFAFTLSGTFCQQPNGSWSFGGTFSIISRNGSPAVGTGTVNAAAGNSPSIVTLAGVLAQ